MTRSLKSLVASLRTKGSNLMGLLRRPTSAELLAMTILFMVKDK